MLIVPLYHLMMLAVVAGALLWLRGRPAGAALLPGVLLFVVGAIGAAAAGYSFLVVRLFSCTLFAYLPLFLAGAAVLHWRRARRAAVLCAALAGLLLLIAADAFLLEPRWLEVTRVPITSPKLARRVRVALITDLQTDRPGRYEAAALRRVAQARPDLILFAGDYVQVDRQRYAAAVGALNDLLRRAGLRAPLGCYAVGGNVDVPAAWTRLFAGTPVTPLEERTRRDLGPLVLTGLSLADSMDPACAVAPEAKFHLVVGHQPDYALGRIGADVLLAGHTHGGQVRLPGIGPLATASAIPRRWAAGVTEIHPGQTLVVSRGVGMERGHAPRLRFLCRPQLVLLELAPAGEGQ